MSQKYPRYGAPERGLKEMYFCEISQNFQFASTQTNPNPWERFMELYFEIGLSYKDIESAIGGRHASGDVLDAKILQILRDVAKYRYIMSPFGTLGLHDQWLDLKRQLSCAQKII